MTKDLQRKALGRGLSALLPNRPVAEHTTTVDSPHEASSVPIELVDVNPLQPRSSFQPERLHELAQSIRVNGIIQPLVVRRRGDRYQLVAGERRWRAARQAGLSEVPVVVREFGDEQLLEITLIENIQREDLNPIEVAVAFDRLIRESHLTHEEIARRTGKDRVTITNTLRLLRLPEEVQNLVAERRISAGHARAIIGLPTRDLQQQVAEKVAAEGLSVRQAERLVQRLTEGREPKTPGEITDDPNIKAAVRELEAALGTRVRIIQKSEQRGRIEIDYYSQEELQRLYSQIVGG
jgi:ParB family chromosome partitioning protein